MSRDAAILKKKEGLSERNLKNFSLELPDNLWFIVTKVARNSD